MCGLFQYIGQLAKKMGNTVGDLIWAGAGTDVKQYDGDIIG
jgi:hypothetical protein